MLKDDQAAMEGKAIRKSNSYQLARPKATKKSHLKYGHQPKRTKSPGPMIVGSVPLMIEDDLAAAYAQYRAANS